MAVSASSNGSVNTSSTIQPSTIQRRGQNESQSVASASSLGDTVEISGKKSSMPSVDVQQGNIAQYPADAIIIPVFEGEDVPAGVADAEAWKQDPNNASLAEVLQNEVAKARKKERGAFKGWQSYAEGDFKIFSDQSSGSFLPKHLILVGLGKRPEAAVAEEQFSDEESAAKDIANTAQFTALCQFGTSSLKDVKRVSLLLPCAERGQKSEEQYLRTVSNAAQALQPLLDIGHGKHLERITIVDADPERVNTIQQALQEQEELSHLKKAQDSSLSQSSTQKHNPDPANDSSTGFFSSIWNAGASVLSVLASVITGMYNGIRGLLGWK